MSQFDTLLIHGTHAFSEEELSSRAEKYGFSQPLILELFAWDYELAVQLQEISDALVLKGGAAVQLHLPPEIQRGSVDLDFITCLQEKELNQLFSELSRKFRGFEPFFQFTRYIPRVPKINLPLSSYDVILPSVFQENCRIKIDILTSDISLPTLKMRDVETFAIRVSRVKTISPGALIGDKLLTLARKTVGIESEEAYPKQIYDIEMLAFKSGKLTQRDIKHAAKAIKKIVSEEARFRDIETSPTEVLEDVRNTMGHYSQVDLSIGSSSTKRSINNFQQLYVNKAERSTRLYEWSSRALRIRFLATLMQSYLSKRINANQVLRSIQKSQEISSRIKETNRRNVLKLRKELLAYAENLIPRFKELKGKPLERVLWQVLTPGNMESVAELSKR
ncbi:MAG: nucleotidyl transferase AbiEii/AbiGii toxin family protein [Candidatus Freyrarchaeum guaymaensis]